MIICLVRLPFWFFCFVRLRCFPFPSCSVDLFCKIVWRIIVLHCRISWSKLTIAQKYYSHAQNCFALLPSLHPWWPWLRFLNCACACSTMLKEQGKRLQLRFNIPNIPENKRNVERMLKQSLKAFKLFQHRFNFASIRLNTAERG